MRRYPALIFVNTPTGDFLQIVLRLMCQIVSKNATDCHHALDTAQEALIVLYFLQTVRVHLDGIWRRYVLEYNVPSPQPANN